MLQIKELIKSYAGWVLVLFHTIGLFLLGGEWRDQLVILTPFNLLLLAGLFLYTSERPTVKWVYYLPILLGFIIELIGTNTGFPFGAYDYGTA
ncbi:MAG: carotenoid biosynthesis protein, partial [Flavobacteriales bacterium]|nr:carotenoid biosynthesis protein [Flavobacteriales bacterium]